MSQNAKFVAETVNGEERFSFFLDERQVGGPGNYNTLEQLPVPGSIELTMDEYRSRFPEDTVEFVDNRVKN